MISSDWQLSEDVRGNGSRGRKQGPTGAVWEKLVRGDSACYCKPATAFFGTEQQVFTQGQCTMFQQSDTAPWGCHIIFQQDSLFCLAFVKKSHISQCSLPLSAAKLRNRPIPFFLHRSCSVCLSSSPSSHITLLSCSPHLCQSPFLALSSPVLISACGE